MTPCRRARQNDGSRSFTSGRGLDLDVERRGEQRRPRHELLVDLLQALAEDGAIVLATAVQLDVEQRAEERPERVVRRRRLVLLAAQLDLPHVGAVLPQLLGESRLPDPGLADELDERSEAHPHRGDGGAEHCPFALAIDERKLVLGGRTARALSGAARSSPRTNAWTGSAFPLSESGSSSVDSNDPPPRVSAPAETQISSSPARAMSRAASAAVSPRTVYVRRKLAPTWPVNTRPSLTPTWTGSGRPAVDDGAHRSEHPLLVVSEGLRSARDEDDASTVAIDVALEEGHAVLVRGRLHRADEGVERVGCGLRPFRLDDLVGSGEADEGDCRMSMLALERPDLEELRSQRRRNRNLERDALDGGQRGYGAADLGSGAEETPVALLLCERVGVEDAPRLCAHEDLSGLRCAFHLHRSCRRRAGDQQLAM